MGIGVSVAAIALGATVIEKHFTLQRADGGVDSAFSVEPNEMAQLVIETERAWQAMGKVQDGPTDKEKASLVFRRSLYVVEDMKAGDSFTATNMRAIRPGYGLAPKFYDEVIGKKVKRDVARGTALSHDLIS
jgi:sialic acid synthase SpsE